MLFAGSVGRTDLPFSDWETLLESIRRCSIAFPPRRSCTRATGPETTLGDEQRSNPFLPSCAPMIKAPRGTHDILPAEQPLVRHVIGTFAELAERYG